MRSRALVLAAIVVSSLGFASAAQAGTLRAGVGRADITPPTGYYMMGWVRSDAKVTGVNTRLWARAIVLEENGHKVALVSEDLNGIPGGMMAAAADLDRDIGFSQENVIDSASHTHAAPTSYYNFGTYNTVFPTTGTPTSFNTAADPQLYTFMVKQLAMAIRRANANLGPAVAGWGHTTLLGLTQNRSIEAHLADFGIYVDYGKGNASMDPGGYPDTIDPEVNVLRVDRVMARGCHKPIGMWSDFADHGTVNKFTWHYYNEDHHGAATTVSENALRAAAAKACTRSRRHRSASAAGAGTSPNAVVDVYGNSDEGDMSAGLNRSGPAAADYVGRVEAQKFLDAWRQAGRSLSGSPPIDERWTRVCFCGQDTDAGAVDSRALVGLPLTTGSEEGRGPLYDNTHTPFEGDHSPVAVGPQGDKIPVFPDASGSTPHAVPLAVLRIGDRMVVTVPGEMTEEMGKRVRAAVMGASGASGVVIAGLANEYLSYFTTPEEYDRQHYEGGSTLYGRASSELLKADLTGLAADLAQGRAAPAPYPYDPGNGLEATSPPFPEGVNHGSVVKQPAAATPRLGRAAFSWQGGQKGYDRPLDTAFVTIRRRVGHVWRVFDSDLGLNTVWAVDDNGVYTAQWEAPLSAPAGTYEFLITARHYTLESAPFRVAADRRLVLKAVPGGVQLTYPAAVVEKDLTYRPPFANAGSVTFTAGRRKLVVRRPSHGGVFGLRGKGPVKVAPGAARDRYGNTNANPLTVRP